MTYVLAFLILGSFVTALLAVRWSEPYKECLVLDPMAEMYIAGCTIDYVEELGGSYLKIINPNATASCGCGESFAI